MEEIFYLHLHRDLLLGFEQFVNSEAIRSLTKAIRKHELITPVIVQRADYSDLQGLIDETGCKPFDVARQGVYFLDRSVYNPGVRAREGGHHRAMAHYLLNKPLPCRFKVSSDATMVDRVGNPAPIWRFIHEIPLRANVVLPNGQVEWSQRKARHGYKY